MLSLNIKKNLIIFHLISGLQVNFHKSNILGVNVDPSWLQNAAKSLQCKIGEFPVMYLGLPIGGNMSLLNSWNLVIDRMEKKLATWKGKTLSIGGRLTLIKASISSLPLYYMSLFPMPKGIIAKIVRLQRQFFWSGTKEKKPYSSRVLECD